MLKFDPQTVTLVTALLVDDSRMQLGITGTSGRGRNKVAIYGWEVDDPSASRASSILVSGAPGKRADQKAVASGVGSGEIAVGGVVGGVEFLWRRRVFQWLHNDVMDETETFSPRISRGRKQLGAAFGAGQLANDVIEVLRTNAKTPVPQSVEFLIHDVQRRHGRVLVCSAVTVITCDDAALLVQAVNVKAAALSLLSPSVAVSLLPAAKVFDALEAKGLLPAMFTGAGSVKGIGATADLDSIQVSFGEPASSVSTNATRQSRSSKPHSESAPPIAIQPINYRSIQTIQADIADARPK